MPRDPKARVSNRLGQFRRERGLTMKQLAKALNVGESAYKKWEYSISYPSIDELMRIADFYGVALDDLFIRDNDDVPFEELSEERKQTSMIVDLFKELNDFGRSRALGYTQGLVDSNAYKNED